MKVLDAALALGATLRLTRLVVTDDLGRWWVKAPLYDLVFDAIPEDDQRNRNRAVSYLSGLDCPFCVGYWIGVGVLAMPRNRAWRFVAGTLTLNYLAGHIGSRLDAE